jgi:NADPH:quinone reductase-like Zn-dependent oxidoreductase
MQGCWEAVAAPGQWRSRPGGIPVGGLVIDPSQAAADLLVLAELITSGKVTPVIDKTYPLSQAPDAIRYMQEGHARGKVVITI